MKKIYFILCLIIMRFDPACLAETPEPNSDNAAVSSTSSSTLSSDKPSSPVDEKKKYHLEIGGNYSDVDNGTDIWKSLDLRLTYSGFKKTTPMASISTLNRKSGSQRIYGFGSYINVSTKFYMIAGISGAPVRDPDVIYYPRLRMDLAGFFSAPIVDGLVLTTGITHFPKHNGGGGDIISVGGIYYGKIILSGSLNYNIAQPGSITSLSGQAGFAYGAQGKYWIGVGVTGGKVAYQLASEIPVDVRYKSGGANLSYSRWLGKNWGVITRLDYGEIVLGESKLLGFTANLFFDF
jgi:YaiO family outer membrane protein